MKLDLLAFAAHPDDSELGCSGTLIAHIQAGKKVGVADLTRGELGTRGTPETRRQEAAQAAEIIGLHARVNLGLADGFFRVDRDQLLAVVKVIRTFQPEIVLANAIPYWEQKMDSIRVFKSQFFDPENTEGPETYISNPEFLRFIEARAREMGHKIGTTFGEGFTKERHLGVRNLFDLV